MHSSVIPRTKLARPILGFHLILRGAPGEGHRARGIAGQYGRGGVRIVGPVATRRCNAQQYGSQDIAPCTLKSDVCVRWERRAGEAGTRGLLQPVELFFGSQELIAQCTCFCQQCRCSIFFKCILLPKRDQHSILGGAVGGAREKRGVADPLQQQPFEDSVFNALQLRASPEQYVARLTASSFS